MIFGIGRDSRNDFVADDAGLYIVIRAETPSPVTRDVASLRSRPLPRRLACASRLIAPSHSAGALLAASSAAAAACATRSAPIPTADPLRVCASVAIAAGVAFADTRHQQFGLPLEELQDFLFEAGIVEGHARQVARDRARHYPCAGPLRSTKLTAPWTILASREPYLFWGL